MCPFESRAALSTSDKWFVVDGDVRVLRKVLRPRFLFQPSFHHSNMLGPPLRIHLIILTHLPNFVLHLRNPDPCARNFSSSPLSLAISAPCLPSRLSLFPTASPPPSLRTVCRAAERVYPKVPSGEKILMRRLSTDFRPVCDWHILAQR